MPTTPQDRKKPTKKASTKKARTPRQPEPVAPDAEGKYAATAWGSEGSDIGGPRDLEVPSGQLCLVKRPGVEGLMTAGVLQDLDTLTSLVGSNAIPAKGGKGKSAEEPEVDIAAIMSDPSKTDALLHTVNRTVCATVIKPPIFMPPNDVTLRKSGVIYADMVDLFDKMFIFQYVVGGSADLETFREEFDTAVGSLDSGEAVEGSPE